jgi:hypothetical protein
MTVQAVWVALRGDERQVYRDAMTRPCPWCRVRSFQRCIDRNTGLLLLDGERVHPARTEDTP